MLVVYGLRQTSDLWVVSEVVRVWVMSHGMLSYVGHSTMHG